MEMIAYGRSFGKFESHFWKNTDSSTSGTINSPEINIQSTLPDLIMHTNTTSYTHGTHGSTSTDAAIREHGATSIR